MTDIKHPGLLWAKGLLFLIGGLITGAYLIFEHPEFKVIGLMLICVWCFARFYYFVFYVIEHYIDAEFKFSGLGSFALYAWRQWQRRS